MFQIILWALVHSIIESEVKVDKKGRTFLSLRLKWDSMGYKVVWIKSVVVYPTKTGYRLLVNYGGLNRFTEKKYSASTRFNIKANRHSWTVIGSGGKYIKTLWPNSKGAYGLNALRPLNGAWLQMESSDCNCPQCQWRFHYALGMKPKVTTPSWADIDPDDQPF